jgi:hypothetical protein
VRENCCFVVPYRINVVIYGERFSDIPSAWNLANRLDNRSMITSGPLQEGLVNFSFLADAIRAAA